MFAIDATAKPPAETGAFTSVGTVHFNMAVNPVSGKVYVSNTEARNEVRFEGPGTFAATVPGAPSPTTVRGHLHEARITVLDGAAVLPRHLNKHINYAVVPSPAGVKDKSLATPLGLAVSGDGTTLYIAAFGSSTVGVFGTAALEQQPVPGGRRLDVQPPQGSDDDAEPARHGEPRADALARRPLGREQSRRQRLRRGRGLQALHCRLRRAARPWGTDQQCRHAALHGFHPA